MIIIYLVELIIMHLAKSSMSMYLLLLAFMWGMITDVWSS